MLCKLVGALDGSRFVADETDDAVITGGTCELLWRLAVELIKPELAKEDIDDLEDMKDARELLWRLLDGKLDEITLAEEGVSGPVLVERPFC